VDVLGLCRVGWKFLNATGKSLFFKDLYVSSLGRKMIVVQLVYSGDFSLKSL
jgi:hypothetical protein